MAPLYLRIRRSVVRSPGSPTKLRDDQGGSRPDRRGGLEGEAPTRQVEEVPGERVHLSGVAAPPTEAEDEEDRGAVPEEAREEPRVCGLLRVRPVRRDDRLTELGRKPSFREVERVETPEGRDRKSV